MCICKFNHYQLRDLILIPSQSTLGALCLCTTFTRAHRETLNEGLFFDDLLDTQSLDQRCVLEKTMPALHANQIQQTISSGPKHCGKYVKFLSPLLKTFPYITMR